MNPDVLSTLLSNPARAEALPREDIPEVLGKIEQLKAALWVNLTNPDITKGSRAVSDLERASNDQLLTAKAAAERLGVDERWIYRRADSLPFTKRLGERTLRFSERGLEQWLAKAKMK